MTTRARALVAFVLLAACSQGRETSLSTVSVALPQVMPGYELAVVQLTQVGATRTITLPADGVAHAEVLVGVPLDLEVTVFYVATDPVAVDAFVAHGALVPQPGPQSVDLDAQRAASRAGSIVPVFEGVLDGELQAIPLHAGEITLRDVATDHVFGVTTWADGMLTLPEGRLIEASMTRPVAPADTFSRIIDTDAFGDGVQLAIGPAPVLEALATSFSGATTVDVQSLFGMPGLTVECGRAQSCDGGELSTFFAVPAGVDVEADLLCRFAEAPALCFPVHVVVDDTPPELSLAIPGLRLAPGATTVEVEVTADEAILPESVSFTVPPGTTERACGNRVVTDARRVRCQLDLADLGTSAEIEVEARAADALGNIGLGRRFFVPATSAKVQPVGVRTYPSRAGTAGVFRLGIELVATESCTFQIITVGLQPPAGSPPGTLPWTSLETSTLDLVVDPLGPPALPTVWASASAEGNPEGIYSVDLYYDSSCDGPGLMATLHLSLGVTTPRWVAGDGRLVVSDRAGGTLDPLPLLGSATLASSVPSVATYEMPAVGGPLALRVQGTGVTELLATANAGDGADMVELEAARGPAVAFLQADPTTGARVTLLDPYAAWYEVDPGVGTPKRLLWESTLDALVVVGSAGVQVLTGRSPRVIPLALPVRDAAVLERVSGEPALAIIADGAAGGAAHLELGLRSGTVGAPAAIAHATCAASGPTRLAANAVTGELFAWGGGCALAYRVESGVPRIVAAAAMTGEARTIALDPRGAYATVLLDDAALTEARAVSVGSEITSHGALPLAGAVTPTVTAVTMDLESGHPITAAYDGALPLLQTYPDRIAPASVSSFGSPAGVIAALTHLVADSSRRVLYTVTNESPPQLHAWSLDQALTPQPVAKPFFASSPVVDAVLVGPQVLSATPDGLLPGGVVTIRGVGFAGGGIDEVYLQGARARVLSATPTALVARVPELLGRLPFGIGALTVGVRSYGRLSQMTRAVTLTTEIPVRIAQPAAFIEPTCGVTPPCAPVVLVADRAQDAGVETVAVSEAATTKVLSYAGIAGAAGAFAAQPALDGVSIIGHGSYASPVTRTPEPRWLDARPWTQEAQRTFALDLQGLAQAGRLSVDPTGRLLALTDALATDAATSAVGLYFAPTYTRAGAPVAFAATGTHATFTPDGRTLVAAGTSGGGLALAAWDVHGDAPAALATSVASCPAWSAPRVVGVYPYAARGADVLAVVLDGTGALVTARLSRDDAGVAAVCGPALDGAADLVATTLAASGEALVLASTGADGSTVRFVDPDDPRVVLGATTPSVQPTALFAGHAAPGDVWPYARLRAFAVDAGGSLQLIELVTQVVVP